MEATNFAKAQLRKHEMMCRRRRELMWTVPITDRRISELDIQLIEHPLTDWRLKFLIYCRIMYVGPVVYDNSASADEKHQMLLELREHYREFCQAPERVQELLRPTWLEWLDTLNIEEQEERERAHG
jgi:hypothetical protein